MTEISTLLVPAALFVILVLTLLFILSRFYRRASKEMSFVRTGMGGEKVILDGGGLKLSLIHI